MEIHQLRCFLGVADEHHFGRAAEALHLTPSPVSRAIRALEAELGTQLFERGYHTVELTPAGELLAKGAAPWLAQFDELKRQVVAQNAGARIVIGGSSFAPPSIFDLFTDSVRAASGSGTYTSTWPTPWTVPGAATWIDSAATRWISYC